ncbi:MAG TPA: rhodanese-like domain-containing protein [Thermoanaerobaculia bacterium]
MPTIVQNPVTEVPAASTREALAHFERLLEFETDCWDVHAALQNDPRSFVLLDVRSPQLYGEGHIDGAVNLPHGRINERNLAAFAADALFVVYCAGPHCNGADRAAIRLARLERPVKKMIGGITGWIEEGYPLVRS